MKLVRRDDATPEDQSSPSSNDNGESGTASDPDTPTRPSQPRSSPEDDDIATAHFPHEYEALYESRDEENTNSNNNDTSYHNNKS